MTVQHKDVHKCLSTLHNAIFCLVEMIPASRSGASESCFFLFFFFSWKHFLPEVSSEAKCCFCLGVNIFRCSPLRNVLCRSNWYMDIKLGVSQKNRGSCLLEMLSWSCGGVDKWMFTAPRKGIPLDSRTKRDHLCTDCRCMFLQTTMVYTNLDFESHRKHIFQKVTKSNAQIAKPISNL